MWTNKILRNKRNFSWTWKKRSMNEWLGLFRKIKKILFFENERKQTKMNHLKSFGWSRSFINNFARFCYWKYEFSERFWKKLSFFWTERMISTNFKKLKFFYCTNDFFWWNKKTIYFTEQTTFLNKIYTGQTIFLNERFYWTNNFTEQAILLNDRSLKNKRNENER